jgi:hypothetical protein
MILRFTELDVKVAAAREELMRIADSDLRSAFGHPTLWRRPSKAAMAVYDEVVRQEEVQAGLDLE